eukprot:TRINITY_DN1288_c0_g1_i1.p1 TRINITY_DN1288_c0_g1~~TRINITY_DN1288_c0_g1_i1.p1  ORF type:complete len:159 (-),score=24.80 TRINITY_DN1288_c0_g1_i1:50-526(-)
MAAMKFKVRAELDHSVKTVEFDRTALPTLQLNELKQTLERRFGVGNVSIRYNFSDGRAQPLYQDFHLADAIKDVQQSRAKYLQLHLVNLAATSASASAATSYNSPSRPTTQAAPEQRARSNTGSSSSPAPSAAMKACPSCSTQLVAAAKFCSSCGNKC